MSQSESKEYPDKKAISLYRSEHVETFQKALDKATEDMETDNPPETERIAHIARSYSENRQFRRLEDDQRIQEARAVVAKDHGMSKEDVSLVALLKVTCSAYTGYKVASDWRPENPENGGFKPSVPKNGENHD